MPRMLWREKFFKYCRLNEEHLFEKCRCHSGRAIASNCPLVFNYFDRCKNLFWKISTLFFGTVGFQKHEL